MRKLLLFVAVSCVAACVDAPEPDVAPTEQAIVGGTADSGHPQVVYVIIQKPDDFGELPCGPDADANPDYGRCTGTLIAPNVVLTARHCLADGLTETNFRVGVGSFPQINNDGYQSHQRAWQDAPYRATRIRRDPERTQPPPWDGSVTSQVRYAEHDLGIIVLDHPMAGVTPITLADYRYPGTVPAGRSLLVAGYGVNDQPYTRCVNKDTTVARRQGQVHVDASYRLALHGVGDSSSANNGQTCFGDSGGPIMSLDGTIQYGVASNLASDTCTANNRAAWAAVPYAEFIYDEVIRAAGCGRIPSAAKLTNGRSVYSCDGRSRLVMQSDGNLVIYMSGYAIWNTGTFNTGASYTEMQGDGNLVVYSNDRTAKWNSGTWNQPGSSLLLRDDGNLVLERNGAVVWQSGSAQPNFRSAMSGASWDGQRIDVFVVGRNYDMLHRWTNGAGWWSAYDSLGSPNNAGIKYDPAAISYAPGHIEVFAVGADNALWHRWWFDSSGWSAWESLGGQVTSSPSVASLHYGHLDVFVRGLDNAFHHRWMDFPAGYGWQGWESRGGTLTSGPAAVAPNFRTREAGADSISIFGKGTDGALYQMYWLPSSGWSGWYRHNIGNIYSDPTVMSFSPRNMNVFWKGGDGSLQHYYWNAGYPWSTPYSLGGVVGPSPKANVWGNSTLTVFGLDTLFNATFVKSWNGSWSNWTQF